MSDFPLLKTGAVMQYPARKALTFSTRVLRFVDGSEQRFRQFGAPLRRWVIHLELLDEAEMSALEEFFRARQGAYGDFSFTDPWEGVEYPNCSFDQDEAGWEFVGEARGGTTLVVKENRS